MSIGARTLVGVAILSVFAVSAFAPRYRLLGLPLLTLDSRILVVLCGALLSVVIVGRFGGWGSRWRIPAVPTAEVIINGLKPSAWRPSPQRSILGSLSFHLPVRTCAAWLVRDPSDRPRP